MLKDILSSKYLTALVMSILSISISAVVADNLPSTITLNGFCAISSFDPNPLAFPVLTPDPTTTKTTTPIAESVGYQNNVDTAKLLVSGTDWTSTQSGPTMPVGATEWKLDTATTFTQLTTAPPEVDTGASLAVTALGTQVIDFHVVVPANQQAASYSQTLTFTISC